MTCGCAVPGIGKGYRCLGLREGFGVCDCPCHRKPRRRSVKPGQVYKTKTQAPKSWLQRRKGW